MFFRVNASDLSPAGGDKTAANQQPSKLNKRVKSGVLSINLQSPQSWNKRRFVQLNIQRLKKYKSREGSKPSHWLCSKAANIRSPLFGGK